MLVRIASKKLKLLWWREVPEVPLIQILPHCCIRNPTGLVRLPKWQTRPLPLFQKPFPERKRVDSRLKYVLNAHLAHDGESTNATSVHVTGDVSFPLVPDVRVDVPPTVPLQNRVDCRPTDFGVPKPEGG